MSQSPTSGGGSWSEHQALMEASRCLYCHDAPCVKGCPVEVNIPEFIRKIVTENYVGAARVVYESNIFGAVCADVCPQSELCAKECNVAQMGEPINIGRLQKFAVLQSRPKQAKILAQGKRVAVIGAGPAGLSGAYALARQGYRVAVMEARQEAGGTTLWGIPPCRLESAVFAHDLARIQELVPDMRFGVEIGHEMSTEALLAEFDAILLSCGLGRGRTLDIPGTELSGVMSAEQMLTEYNTTAKKGQNVASIAGKRVIVIGGGNTAMDVATVARRAGANVTVLYRRTLGEMTAWQEEYQAASSQGVEFRWQTAPVAILGQNHVTAVRAVYMQSGRHDSLPGNLEQVPNSEHDVSCDFVVVAIGQVANPLVQELSGHAKVFLAGDALNGGATVVQAVAEGQQAALSIDVFLRQANVEAEGN